ncbi:MAG TPA: LysE family transporter [Candidatus Binatia bacterium]
MAIHLLIKGAMMGFVVAVPVGPLGLLCINRALSMGPWYGLYSGLGIATADALAGGIAALSMTLVSQFLVDHQFAFRLVGGVFLCYLGYEIYYTLPGQPPAQTGRINGLLGTYVATFLLTLSSPVTILSFAAIYAAWHAQSMIGHYGGAAVFAVGVFIGSASWWVALFLGLTLFRERFNLRLLWWIHRISGGGIAVFGVVLLLSISPLSSILGMP